MRFSRADTAACGAFLVYSSAAVATPICLLRMSRDLEFTLAGGGGIEVARTLLILLTLLFSGWAAARSGKMRTLALGLLLMGVGLLAFSQVRTYAAAVVCMMAVGFGSGFVEALVNPLVQDLHPRDAGKYLNVINAFYTLGVVGAVLVVGEVLTAGAGWRVVFAVIGLAALAVAALFRSCFGTPLPASAASWGHVREILRAPKSWVFGAALFFGGATEAAFTFWSAAYIQLNFADLPRAGAVGTACFAGAMTAGRVLTGKLADRFSLWALIVGSALGGIVVSLFVSSIHSLGGLYALLIAAGFCVACFWPSIQGHAAEVMAVDSTLLFIFLSCFGIPGIGFACWVMGMIGDRAGLRQAFLVVPVFFALLATVLLVERHLEQRGKRRAGAARAG